MARLALALACVCLALSSGVQAGTAVPSYNALWTSVDPLNCFVVSNYRITNAIFSTAKAGSAGACFRRCAASWLAMSAAPRNCQSWTFNKRTRRCSLTEGYLGFGAGEGDTPMPNWAPSSSYVSGYLIDKYD